ncbi:hypothetical protein TrVFT333_010363 [Trichoderma virens FT-333]|nr:hypothetical protein TrVFT333_010363 [Trichoderma virens FT-333]
MHLKDISLLSLQLTAFQERLEEENGGSNIGDEQKETAKGDKSTEPHIELDTMPVSFKDIPISLSSSASDMAPDSKSLQPTPAGSGDCENIGVMVGAVNPQY